MCVCCGRGQSFITLNLKSAVDIVSKLLITSKFYKILLSRWGNFFSGQDSN